MWGGPIALVRWEAVTAYASPLVRVGLATLSFPALLPALARHGVKVADFGVPLERPSFTSVSVRPRTVRALLLAQGEVDAAKRREAVCSALLFKPAACAYVAWSELWESALLVNVVLREREQTGGPDPPTRLEVVLSGDDLFRATPSNASILLQHAVRRVLIESIVDCLIATLGRGGFSEDETDELLGVTNSTFFTSLDPDSFVPKLRNPPAPVDSLPPLDRFRMQTRDFTVLQRYVDRMSALLQRDVTAKAAYRLGLEAVRWNVASERNEVAHPPVPPALFRTVVCDLIKTDAADLPELKQQKLLNRLYKYALSRSFRP